MGHPITPDGPAWKKDGSNTAAEQEQQVGSHHDGMHLFPPDEPQTGEGCSCSTTSTSTPTLHYADGMPS